MSQHLSQDNKKITPKEFKFNDAAVKSTAERVASWFGDTELDLEHYELDALHAAVFGAGILMLVLSLAVKAATLKLVLAALSLAAMCAFPVLNIIFNLRQRKPFCEAELMLIPAIALLAVKEYSSSVAIAAMYYAFKLFQGYILRREQSRAETIFDLMPDTAEVYTDGEIRRIKPGHIEKDDYIVVAPGNTIPADGYVIDGVSTVDYSPLTRNGRQDNVSNGSAVVSGCVNLTNRLIIKATAVSGESMAQKVYSYFRRALKSEPAEGTLARRVLAVLSCVGFVLLAVFCIIVPVFSKDWITALKRAAFLLMAACPLGILSAVSLGAYAGVEKIFASGAVIKDSSLLKKIAAVKTMIFNKTGTVTEGEYTVSGVFPHGIDEQSFLSIVSRVESNFNNPIADAIKKYCGVGPDTVYQLDSTTEEPGLGITAVVGGNTIIIGNAKQLTDRGFDCDVPARTGIALHVAINSSYCGYIMAENKIRASAFDSLVKTRSAGVGSLVLLSKDLSSVTRPIGSALNFDIMKAELTDSGKAAAVDYIMNNKGNHSTVAYVGYRNHEDKAGSKADVYITTDAVGTKECLDGSDVCVLAEGIDPIPEIISAGANYALTARINLIAALAVRLLMIIMVIINFCPPVVGAAGVILVSAFTYADNSFITFRR